MKIKLNKLTVENVGRWISYSRNQSDDIIEHMWHVVSIFFNIPFSKVKDMEIGYVDDKGGEGLTYYYFQAMNQLNKVKERKEPSEVITIEGKKFKWDKNISKIKTGQVADIRKLGEGIFSRPAYLLAVLYQSDGVTRQESEELFKEKFPIDEFLAVSSFFLSTYESLKRITFQVEKAQVKENLKVVRSLRRGFNGRTQYTRLPKTLIKMWTILQTSIIHLFYFGRNFSLRNQK